MTPANPDALADARDLIWQSLKVGAPGLSETAREALTHSTMLKLEGKLLAPLLADLQQQAASISSLEESVNGLEADLQRVTAERDDLKIAAGFKPGDFQDGLSRDVILNDIAGMRPAMIEARRAEARVQNDADLWTMRMLGEWPGDTLLLRLWRQRQEAMNAKAAAEARAARLQAEVEAMKAERTSLRADANVLGAKLGSTSIYDDPKWLRDLCWEAGNFLARRIVSPDRTALAARAATTREGA